MKYITKVMLCIMGADWNIVLNSIDVQCVVANLKTANNVPVQTLLWVRNSFLSQ